jgi:hypothetical protein
MAKRAHPPFPSRRHLGPSEAESRPGSALWTAQGEVEWAWGCLIALLLCAATPAFADVVSHAPDAVSVTVYRDHAATAASLRSESGDTAGLAMIAETRTVDLPAGRTRISFEGVADAIIPASAALTGLPGRLVERNFDYDLLDPGSLIEKTVGQSVTIRRSNPKTGKLTEEPAALRSGPDGVVVVTSGGVEALSCGTGPQALVFDHLPPGLADRPTLSVIVDAPHAGRYTLTLSYLVVRIDWSADYVARLSADGTTLELTGWLTLSNRSGASFANAPTSVVAGALARLAPDLPDIAPKQVNSECWPMGTTSDFPEREVAGRMAVDEVMTEMPAPAPPAGAVGLAAPMTSAVRRTVQTNLGDYKLYSLIEPTTLAARQTKQIRFLHQTGVKFEKLYMFRADAFLEQGERAGTVSPTTVVLRFQNKTEDGLGLALPAGMVSIRQPQEGRELYVGEHGVRDVPTNEEFELEAGAASDVEAQGAVVSDQTKGDLERKALQFTVTNAKSLPVTFELRQSPARAEFKIVAESSPHVLKNGDDVWRVVLPANGSATLSYTFEALKQQDPSASPQTRSSRAALKPTRCFASPYLAHSEEGWGRSRRYSGMMLRWRE